MTALFLLAQTAYAQELDGQQAADKLKDLSFMEKLSLVLSKGEITQIMTGIILIFIALVFLFLFFRRMNVGRMGYFFITLLIIFVRAVRPEIVFWTPAAIGAAFVCFVLFILSHKNVEYDSRKEPLYFLFNTFALLMAAFPMGGPMGFYNATLALIALISSLFFVVTKKHVPHGKFKKHEADEAILNVLEKKKNRAL